ncbi:MAG: hypothetical protein R3D98_10480 [Candidatus Krumholzibacteriia bacterium]
MAASPNRAPPSVGALALVPPDAAPDGSDLVSAVEAIRSLRGMDDLSPDCDANARFEPLGNAGI